VDEPSSTRPRDVAIVDRRAATCPVLTVLLSRSSIGMGYCASDQPTAAITVLECIIESKLRSPSVVLDFSSRLAPIPI
jgi:hypothetical protein